MSRQKGMVEESCSSYGARKQKERERERERETLQRHTPSDPLHPTRLHLLITHSI
jgi:hypothetical protein